MDTQAENVTQQAADQAAKAAQAAADAQRKKERGRWFKNAMMWVGVVTVAGLGGAGAAHLASKYRAERV